VPTLSMTFAQKSWRLSPMYFFYFALFGIFIPYIARFLTDKGLNGQEISIIVATIHGVNMFAPFIFSYLADKTGRRMIFIRLGYIAMAVFYLSALLADSFWLYLASFGLFGVFLSATLPQMESITLSILGSEQKRYGQVRLWGSIGFVSIVWVVGSLLDTHSVDIIIYFGFVAILLMVASTFLIPDQSEKTNHHNEKNGQPLESIPWKQVFILLLAIIFWQFGMAPFNTFFDLYLRGHGHSASANGFLISFGSFSEIVIFFSITRLFMCFSERSLMAFALFATVIRWLLVYSFAEYFWVMFASQAIHALSFGLVHSVAIHRIAHLFPEGQASFGQGLYVALGTGLGLLIGNLLAGWFWDGSGLIYLFGAGWTVLALGVGWFGFGRY
jgi:MFS transporter, PPP family, 3-phenylpropionic acid transporter